MARPPRLHYPGAIYHVMGRGVGGMALFTSDEEYLEFLAVLEDVARKTGCHVLAYCPLGNHFHLLMEVGDVPISNIMSRVMTRYAKRFNKARNRKGHVFQARFLSKMVCEESYFVQCLRYIHRNPLEAGVAETLEDWPWSSHRQFVGRIRSTLLDLNRALAHLATDPGDALRRYRRLMGAAGGTIADLEPEKRPSVKPAPKPQRPALSEISGEIQQSLGIDVTALSSKRRTRPISQARRAFAERAAEFGYRVADIAQFLGLRPSSVCVIVHARL